MVADQWCDTIQERHRFYNLSTTQGVPGVSIFTVAPDATHVVEQRAVADVLEIEQQRIAAASAVRIAQSYVNLLRNAPLAAPLPQGA